MRRFRLLRFAFDRLYNELAWSYDAVSWLASLGEWRAWQRAALPFLELPVGASTRGHARVLEIAHGPGHMLAALARAGHRPVGLDLSRAMGRLAGVRLARAGVAAPLVRARAERLPFAPGAFDAVLATFPTEFILDPATLAGIHRVLRPRGVLVLVPLARFHRDDPASRALEWLYGVTGQRGPADPQPVFARPLAAAGFATTVHQVPLKRAVVTVVQARQLP